jgi:cell division protein FtsB
MAWLMPFGLLVYAMCSVPVRILSEEGLPRYRRLQEQLTKIRSENVALAQDIERLNRDVKSLLHDPEAVERIARDELGMIREGELLFQFEPN